MGGYCIENGEIKPIKRIRVGVNNAARDVVKGYVGVNGIARLIYEENWIDIPTIDNYYKYNGSNQRVIIHNFNSDEVIISGTEFATNVGTYYITFSLKNQNKVWIDGTKTDKTYSWEIVKKILEIPYIVGAYTYNKTEQELLMYRFNEQYMIKGGTLKATNVGDYSAYVDLLDPDNCMWSDNTTERKVFTWHIYQATGSISVSGYDGSELHVEASSTNIYVVKGTPPYIVTSFSSGINNAYMDDNLLVVRTKNLSGSHETVSLSTSDPNYTTASMTMYFLVGHFT